MTTLRVAALQMPHGPSLDENLATAHRMVEEAHEAGAALAVLPEYFFAAMEGAPADDGGAVRDFLAHASHKLAVAGNVVEEHDGARRNVGVVYEAGAPVLEQWKVHPMPRELDEGFVGGDTWATASVAGIETGMLVCADVLYPEASRILALRGAKILLNPVLSAYREPDPDQDARKALYVARAYDAGAFVIKAGGFLEGRIAGRSLVAAPWGMLAHADGDFEERLLMADLDLGQLEAFRNTRSRFPQRRPEAYGELSRRPPEA